MRKNTPIHPAVFSYCAGYHTEPSPMSPRKNIKTVRTDETEELTNVEYIPASTPIPTSLAPGPNTKVTTTIKTYTYELPGAPESYMPPSNGNNGGSLSRNVNVDKSISYSLPRDSEKSITYHVSMQMFGAFDSGLAVCPQCKSFMIFYAFGYASL